MISGMPGIRGFPGDTGNPGPKGRTGNRGSDGIPGFPVSGRTVFYNILTVMFEVFFCCELFEGTATQTHLYLQ